MSLWAGCSSVFSGERAGCEVLVERGEGVLGCGVWLVAFGDAGAVEVLAFDLVSPGPPGGVAEVVTDAESVWGSGRFVAAWSSAGRGRRCVHGPVLA